MKLGGRRQNERARVKSAWQECIPQLRVSEQRAESFVITFLFVFLLLLLLERTGCSFTASTIGRVGERALLFCCCWCSLPGVFSFSSVYNETFLFVFSSSS